VAGHASAPLLGDSHFPHWARLPQTPVAFLSTADSPSFPVDRCRADIVVLLVRTAPLQTSFSNGVVLRVERRGNCCLRVVSYEFLIMKRQILFVRRGKDGYTQLKVTACASCVCVHYRELFILIFIGPPSITPVNWQVWA